MGNLFLEERFSVKGKVAVVTGASRGIGKSIAITLAKAGAYVVVNCQKGVEQAEAVLSEIKKNGGDGEVKSFSVSDAGSVGDAFEDILKRKGAVHILVNNAGVAKDALLMRAKEDEWDATIDTNLKGAFLCTQAVTRAMMKQRDGAIINISSVVGQMGNAGQTAYSASKAGMIGMTKSVARELASRNVRSNVVTPGFIETDMTDAMPQTAKDEMLRSIPLGSIGSAQSVADAVLWLASPGASYVTGQVIAVNGGLYM